MIPVLVVGAAGKMGREVVRAVAGDSETQLVGAVGRQSASDVGEFVGIGALGVPLSDDLDATLKGIQAKVAVEFSVPSAVRANISTLLKHGVAPVVGTTGLSESDLEEIDAEAKAASLPVLVAPNFALGAILMMRFAAQAAQYFDSAEIIEYHHEKKLDAPSGTAFKTALLLRESKGRDFERVEGDDANAPGARGGDIGGVSIHSVRLPGYLAHQEVIFGLAGQTLNIRHDTITRECYMPGVLLAVKKVLDLAPGVTFGLENVI